MTGGSLATYIPETVLITGGGSGFGAAAARRFAAMGSRVVLAGRRRDRLEETAAAIGGRSHVAVLDVRDRAAVLDAVAGLPAEFAAIDLLVNNAGLALGLDPAQSASLDDWDTMVDTNVKGMMYCARAVLPGMVERRRGHIVDLSSIAGTYPYPGGNVYCASKAFVTQFTLALRSDLHGTGVRMTSIEPGLCDTEFSITRFKGDAERAKALYADTQALSADDVAETVVWCATLPPHININRLEVMPTVQSFGPMQVKRGG